MKNNFINLTETQKRVLEIIKEQRAYAIFLDMGVGKTALMLSLIEYLMFEKLENINALIILPAQVGKVFQVWQKEIQKWDNFNFIDFILVEGNADKRKKIISEKNSSITIISNNLVGWLAKNSDFSKYNFIIVDESSEYKSHKTKRFKELSRLVKDQRIYLLSGTPVPKNWMDIWSQIYLLDKGERLSANFYHFRNTYFYQFKDYFWSMKKGAKEEIIEAIKDIAVFGESDVSLPPVNVKPTYLNFTPEKQKIFNSMKNNFVAEWEEGEITALSTATMINKCLQLSNGMAYTSENNYVFFDDTKLKWLENFVKTTTDNVLVFYIYRFDKENILKIKGARAIESVKDVDDWNEGKIKLGVISPHSMKFGGNMQFGGHTIVWFGLAWNLLNFLQSNKRVWRRGQKHEVDIYYLMMNNTFDGYVYKNLIEKKLSQEELLNAIKIKK